MSRGKKWLFLGILALFSLSSNYLILRQSQHWEWRANERLTLTPAQREALRALPPVRVEIYARNHPPLRRALQNLLRPLKGYLPNLEEVFINPDLNPLAAATHNITAEGQIYVQVGERGQKIEIPSLPALLRVLLDSAAPAAGFVVHLQGHGERAYLSDSADGWRALYQRLRDGDVASAPFELSSGPLPDNSDLLVIADPDPIPAADQARLAAALDRGVNLLYSTDSSKRYLPEFLQKISGLTLVPGTLVSAKSAGFGLDNPQFLVVEELGDTAITRSLSRSPLLPGAVALLKDGDSAWQRTVLLWSDDKSWAESGDVGAATVKFDAGDRRGPLPLGWLLSRAHPREPGRQQHIVILGDSDWASAAYLPLGGNGELLNNLIAELRPAAVNKIIVSERPDQFITLGDEPLLALALVLFGLGLAPLVLALGLWWRDRPWREAR